MAVQIFVKRSSIYRYILKEVMWSSFELYVILSIRYYHRMIYILLSIMSEIWYKRVVYGYDGNQCPIWVNSQVLFWRSPSSPHQNKNTHTVHLCPGMCWWPPLICQQHTQPQFAYFLSYAGGHIWFVSNTHIHTYIMQDYRRNIHAKLVFKETSRFKEPDALKNTCDT